jgi:hypothetical protein
MRMMRTVEEEGAALARAVRGKIRRAASQVDSGQGDYSQRLVDAWPYLRPLFPNTVPGQAGLSEAQKRELQSILDAMGGAWGAGANGPFIRRLAKWEVAKVTDGIRRLAAGLPADSKDGGGCDPGRPAQIPPTS